MAYHFVFAKLATTSIRVKSTSNISFFSGFILITFSYMNNWLHMAFSESKPRSLVMHVKNMPEKTWNLFSRSKYYLFILMMYFPKWKRLSLSIIIMIEFTGTLALHLFLLIAYSAGVNLQRHLLTFEETKGKQVTCNKLSYMGVLNKIITEVRPRLVSLMLSV